MGRHDGAKHALAMMMAAGVAGVGAPLAAAEPPDGAGIVSRIDVRWSYYLEDFDTGLVATSGAPAETWCQGGEAPVTQALVVDPRPNAPLKINLSGEQDVYVYEADGIGDLCERALAGTVEPVAVAEDVPFLYTDNYWLYEPGGRSNPLGLTAHGTAYDADGEAHRLNATLRLRISSDFELFVYRESVRLTPLPG